MADHTVLLLGRTPFDLEAVRGELHPSLDVDVLTGTSLSDVDEAFRSAAVDTVIMGAGIDLESRLEIIRHVFTVSDQTTVHMKDRSSGKTGMMAFVNRVLTGLAR